MVEVLGPWLVPVEAVVSDPTAGAKMKSMSPSVDKIKDTVQQFYLKCQHITTKTKSSQQRRVRLVLVGYLGSRIYMLAQNEKTHCVC